MSENINLDLHSQGSEGNPAVADAVSAEAGSTQSLLWQCCDCQRVWPTREEAEECESWHGVIQQQMAAFMEAQRSGRELLGNFARTPQGETLVRVLWVAGPDREMPTAVADWIGVSSKVLYRFRLSDGTEIRDFLPLPSDDSSRVISRYLSIEEALSLQWCPFFMRGYQKVFPREFREKMAAAFMAMPIEAQRSLLLSGQAFTRSPVSLKEV